jgi:hypothetical protein
MECAANNFFCFGKVIDYRRIWRSALSSLNLMLTQIISKAIIRGDWSRRKEALRIKNAWGLSVKLVRSRLLIIEVSIKCSVRLDWSAFISWIHPPRRVPTIFNRVLHPSSVHRGLLSCNASAFVSVNSTVMEDRNVNYIIHNRQCKNRPSML